MIFNILTRLIEKGQTEGLADKIDVFFAVGKITEDEYKALLELLNKGA